MASKTGFTLTALAAFALLAGCAASLPQAEVTRFHVGPALQRGEIAIAARDEAGAGSLAFDNYAMSIARELRAQGFTVLPSGSASGLVALIDVSQQSHATGPARSPFSIGIGGGSGGGGVGIGGGITFPIGRATAPESVRTELFLQIRRRSDDSALWEGRARLDARQGTPYASTAAAVDRLATALFKDFPGESGRTIVVK